jgi:integrase
MAQNKLTALQIKAAPDGKLFDGSGLTLVKKAGGGYWVYRYSLGGKRREMGLGPFPDVGLADARKVRDAWAAVLASGRDPLSEREAKRAQDALDRDRHDPTFEEMTMIVFDAKKASMRGEGVRGRWLSPLRVHIFPKIGRVRMSALHQTDIRDAVAPVWKKKHPTALKCIDRIGVVFKAARLMGMECDPFTVQAARHMLGEVDHKVVHIVATPWREIPALYLSLDGEVGSRRALRWMILTLVRSDGCRHAQFGEIENAVWTVPADRVKGSQSRAADFRVPLSDAALRIMDACAETHDRYLFPAERGSGGISDVALHKTLNRIGETGRPHGFRTSFRTWVQETEVCSFDVAETVLGHMVGGKVERAYARSDLLDQRRVVMEKWAAHVTGQKSVVVPLRRGG